MAVISLRLNAEEEKILSFLTEEYEKDKSSLIKYSLQQMYEDAIDKKVIEDYEKKEMKNKNNFVSAEDIKKVI